MQKTQELLLILSAEERDAAENFIRRKLNLLDADSLTELEGVEASGRAVLEQIRKNSSKINARSRAGKMLTRIYSSALEGFENLIRECDRAISQKKKDISPKSVDEESNDLEPVLDKLMIEINSEDEEHAGSVIDTAIAEMDLVQMRELRDSAEELLAWWQTDSGLHESLHIDQWGDVNTAIGRMAIRKTRDEFQKEEILPFRSFFQIINVIYQKKNQETQRASRKKRLRQEFGQNE